MLRHCTGKELYYRKKYIYISLKSLRNTYIFMGRKKKKKGEKKAHVSHLTVNNNQAVLHSLHWLHLCHYLPFPQWQNLIVVCYFFLDHSHVQVVTLCLEEVPAPIQQVCQHTIPPHEMQIQWSQNGKDSLSYTGSNIMDIVAVRGRNIGRKFCLLGYEFCSLAEITHYFTGTCCILQGIIPWWMQQIPVKWWYVPSDDRASHPRRQYASKSVPRERQILGRQWFTFSRPLLDILVRFEFLTVVLVKKSLWAFKTLVTKWPMTHCRIPEHLSPQSIPVSSISAGLVPYVLVWSLVLSFLCHQWKHFCIYSFGYFPGVKL